AGRNMSGREFMPIGVESFAYMAVQKGYIAVAIRWYGESYGEWYSEAVANLKLRHPQCTGLGKWVWDAHRLIDHLYTMPEVDRMRIGIIGHSLGAKMALYAAAFDDRITAVVCNEGGIGLAFSNYEDYWYFGDFIQKMDNATDQHELLGLIAPRPFLLSKVVPKGCECLLHKRALGRARFADVLLCSSETCQAGMPAPPARTARPSRGLVAMSCFFMLRVRGIVTLEKPTAQNPDRGYPLPARC